MSILNKFDILSDFDQQLVNDIKLMYLTDEQLLFVTNDNLISHYDIDNKRLRKFKTRKVIVKFVCGYRDTDYGTALMPHFMALTIDGYVYSWGDNSWGQLGNGTHISCYDPTLIYDLCPYFITDICCGFEHSLVLTRYGNVYAFGNNIDGQCGNNCTVDQLIPIRVEITNVSAISCGFDHCMALKENGEVFGWGCNDFGELGIGNNEQQLIPTKLNVPKIRQISCGNNYTVLLSSDGDVYLCGDTFNGLPYWIPIKINLTAKFVKIAATMHSELCVALSIDNKCFMFKSCDSEGNEVSVKELVETEFASIDETFAFYGNVTYRTIAIKRCEKRFKEMNSFRNDYSYAIKRKEFNFDELYISAKRMRSNSEISKRKNLVNSDYQFLL